MNELQLIQNSMKAFDKYGQFDYTIHENMFASLFPQLERQVAFGTGKNGFKKWGSKKYTVDFFDKDNQIAYEIDGKSHERLYVQVTDEMKRRFLLSKGIEVVRVKNEHVKELFNEQARRGGEVIARIIC